MKNRIRGRVVFTLLILLCCSGCPLESPEPLNPVGSEALDTQLIGEWVTIQDGDKEIENGSVSIFIFNSSEYYLEVTKDRIVEDRYAAHPSTIAGQKFLNIRDIGNRESTYSFIRYVISPSGELSFQFVREEFFEKTGVSATEIRKVLERQTDDPALFEDSGHRLRKVSPVG